VTPQKPRTPPPRGHYTEALRLEPRFSDAHNGLGGALLAQERIGEAIAHFEEAVRLEPGFLAARHNLAAALAQEGRTDEAVRQLEAALTIDPADETARRGLEILRGRKQKE